MDNMKLIITMNVDIYKYSLITSIVSNILKRLKKKNM